MTRTPEEEAENHPAKIPSGGPTSLPAVKARAVAFVAIIVAGLCGGLIGSSLVRIQCSGDCATPTALGGLTGAVTAAGGVAVVCVLVLRAMGEWQAGTGTQRRARPAQQASSRPRPPGP